MHVNGPIIHKSILYEWKTDILYNHPIINETQKKKTELNTPFEDNHRG